MTPCKHAEHRLLAGMPPDPEHAAACPDCTAFERTLALIDRGLGSLRTDELPPTPAFDRLELAAAAAARSLRLRRAAAPLFAVAACAALALVGWWRWSPQVLTPGAIVSASANPWRGEMPGGARVTIEDGEIQLLSANSAETRLLLTRGSVTLTVPRLPRGSVLAVQTADAAVVVHGTRLVVRRSADATDVHVMEGLVEVRPAGSGRAAFYLRPGEKSTIESLPVYRRGLYERALAALDRSDLGSAGAALEALLATEPPAVLAGEARSLLAWQRHSMGDLRAAIAEYRAALAFSPAGSRPLWAENAAAELALLLERTNDRDATAAWRDYLSRFPDGAHAALARARLANRKHTR